MTQLPAHFEGLNEKQLSAACFRRGRALVSAGAGTGKTKTLVARYLSLLLDSVMPVSKERIGVENILTITYTNAGADEIKQRVREELDRHGHTALANRMDQAWVSTIHGFCARLLRRYAVQADIDPDFTTATEVRAKKLQTEAFDELLSKITLSRAPAHDKLRVSFDDYLALRETLSDFAIRKHVLEIHDQLRQLGLRRFNDDLGTNDQGAGQSLHLSADWPHRLLVDDCSNIPGSISGQSAPGMLLLRFVADFAKIYQRLCFEQSVLDYNELLLSARALLDDKQILQELQSQFIFTMIDEAQDTNALQMEIITKIAGDNLYQVGDSKQSIYGFQGANLSVMQAYRDSLTDAGNIFKLTDNYRSDASILAFVNTLFGNNELLGHPATQLTAQRSSNDQAVHEGHSKESRGVHVLQISSSGKVSKQDKADIEQREASWIADQFQAEQRKGRCWSDFIALVQNRKHGQALLAEFNRRKIPAVLKGGESLFGTPIVKDARIFLELLAKPRDPEPLLKTLLGPLGRVSDQGILELARLRKEAGVDYLWDAALLVHGATGAALSDEQDQHALTGLVQTVLSARTLIGIRPLSEIIGRAFSEREVDVHYLTQGALAGRQAYAAFQQFLRLADEWQARGKDPLSFAEDLTQQETFGLRTQQDVVSLAGEECVTIDTIHSSKGREYPVVALPLTSSLKTKIKRETIALHQLTDSCQPAQGQVGDCVLVRRDSTTQPAKTASEDESFHYDELHQESYTRNQLEAIRLLYVACTRAEEKLLISYSDASDGDGLSDAVRRGMNAAADELQQLQDAGSLTVEQVSIGEQ